MNENHSHQDHDHHPDAASDWSTMLDLDAELLGGYLQEVPARTTAYVAEPEVVLDLGAGTGVGTLALARAFPTARVLALDSEAAMLEQVEAHARRAGLGDRVVTRVVDLDAPWPADLPPADLVWASGALHHVSDPERLLRDLAGALTPQGVLALVEMARHPTYLSDPGLEERIAAQVDHHGMEPFTDWGPRLPDAGWEVLDRWSIHQEAADPARRTSVAALATAFLTRMRSAVGDRLDAADRDALDRLLSPDHAESLSQRHDLRARGHRRAWLARPAAPATPDLS